MAFLACNATMYSTSIVETATIGCLCEDQLITPPFKGKAELVMDFFVLQSLP